ncbi:hypothetical protein PH5382_01131 [Phaeobacter sp. CECT 5382]|uniref:DUF1127 domain-containing protein n=1 Tax=Rhodobacterales TaxID=204455 RepID=UPI0006DAF034|nr:DUF1127 domain-containing protein [Phaeobacter sp. CECT 5382]CUH87206.1 hypothetical protein PH5382_01131 [Phaeobacter sp. CECT 5382]
MTYIAANRTAAPCTHTHRRFGLLSLLADRAALLRQRRALKKMDDRALDDIGLSRAQAEAEAKRPLWDAPESWRC